MTDIIDTQGYRANIGIVLMRDDGNVFLGRRVGRRGWQFPQGGMQHGEEAEQAMYRELHEEIGLEPQHVKLCGATRDWLHYRLPARYVRRDSKPLCIGQKQRWFLLKLRCDDSEIRFDTSAEQEFDHFRWAQYWEPLRAVIPFKRKVYEQALHELAPLAFPGQLPPYPAWWPDIAPSAARDRRQSRQKSTGERARRG